jgi:hypothetical protein
MKISNPKTRVWATFKPEFLSLTNVGIPRFSGSGKPGFHSLICINLRSQYMPKDFCCSLLKSLKDLCTFCTHIQILFITTIYSSVKSFASFLVQYVPRSNNCTHRFYSPAPSPSTTSTIIINPIKIKIL